MSATTVLSEYFPFGIGWKHLKEVEVNPTTSNQHEFNGVNSFRAILGSPEEGRRYTAHLLYVSDSEETTIDAEIWVTWYDSRKAQSHRSAEYRLYFPANAVTGVAKTGDLLVIGRRSETELLLVIAKEGDIVETQIRWLFGIPDGTLRQPIRHPEELKRIPLGYGARAVLRLLGIEALKPAPQQYLKRMLSLYGMKFPTTAEFSRFARETLHNAPAVADDPDSFLLSCMDWEEKLFLTLEEHLVGIRLDNKFQSVDEFIRFSLGVHNRRKSRVGLALENHLQFIFEKHKLRFLRGGITENKSRPDFLFPGGREYADPSFPTDHLFLLGAKSTCKERWRQVLAEGDRIARKHLLTLEAAISASQLQQMRVNNLCLVLPSPLLESYPKDEAKHLLTLGGFIEAVRVTQPGL